MTSRQIVSMALVLLTCVVIAAFIAPQIWPRQSLEPAVERYRRTRAVMDEIRFMKLETRDSVKSSLRTMLVDGVSSPGTGELHASLLEFLTDAIWFYYGVDDPKQYRLWRLASGAVMQRESMVAGGRLNDLHTMLRHIDEASPDDLDLSRPVEELFDAFWSITRRANRGANRAVAIASAPPGLACQWFTTEQAVVAQPMLTGGIGSEAWYGGISMSAMRWFEPTSQDAGPSIAVTVGVVFEFADGLKRPVLFTCIRSAGGSRWDLAQVTMANFPPEKNLWPWQL